MKRRSDDNPDALRTRLEAFHKQTTPLIEYYNKKGIYTSVDASKPAAQVYDKILNAFKKAKSKDLVLFV